MAHIIAFEGARGGGKSTVARMLRETLPSSTLINLTGFKDDDEAGKEKIHYYYVALMQYLHYLPEDAVIILDRFFVSEAVYSKLYKSYDFSKLYEAFLMTLALQGHKLDVFFFFMNDEHEIAKRLEREKQDYFARYEAVTEIIKQTAEYSRVFDYTLHYLEDIFPHYYQEKFRFHEIKTDRRDPKEIHLYVKNLIRMK